MNTTARIAYLLSQYPAVNHVFMLREVRLLREIGFEIRVASIRPPDRPLTAMTEAEQEEVPLTYYVKQTGWSALGAAHARTLLSHPVNYLRALAGAVRMSGARGLFYFGEAVLVGHWMLRNGISHAHTHYVSTVGLWLARIFPVTMSATFHGPAEFEDVKGTRLREKIAAARFACAISQYGLSQLMAASRFEDWEKLEATPLGVDPGEFPPRPFRRDAVPFQLVSVGRLAPVKGQHVLIAALQQLAARGRSVRLRLAGDGPDRAELQRDVKRRGLERSVVFEGNLNQNQLRQLYREADALVLSSFAEGLPVVLMEAMAMEIPCVATWVNGIPEIITHEMDGLLVPPGDAAALAEAIARLMDDPDLRQRLGQRGRGKVTAAFDVRRNTQRLADIFRRRI